MRKKVLLLLTALIMAGTTGCYEEIDLNEEQQDKLVQYSVYSVLEHDKNYLVGLEQVEISDEPYVEEAETMEGQEQSTEATEENNGSDNQNSGEVANPGVENETEADDNVVANLAEAIGLSGISITYKGMNACDSFPENDGTPAFVIKAVTGKKLVILSFDMTNTTAQDIAVDVSSKDISVKGIFNNSIKTNAQVTLLPEALNTYVGTIPAGGTVNTVLVFEMSDGYVNNLTGVSLQVKSEGMSKTVNLQ